MPDDSESSLKLQVELAKLKYNFRTTLAATVIGPIILALIQLWIAREHAKTTKEQAAKVEQTAIAKAAEIKTDLDATKAQTVEKLDALETKADLTMLSATSTNAINTKWIADKTGDPQDKAKAEAAAERLEKVAEMMP